MSTPSTIKLDGDVEISEAGTGPVFLEAGSTEEGDNSATSDGSGMPVQDPNPGGGGSTGVTN